MDLGSDYYFIVIGKDCKSSVNRCIESLINQFEKPAKINVIDDGSTDGTQEELMEWQKSFPNLIWVDETNDPTRNYRKIPKLENMGLKSYYEFHCVVPMDAVLQLDYAQKILAEFRADKNLVVASGNERGGDAKVPRGAGRFVRQWGFFNETYKDGYPEVCGFETEIIYRALQKGKKFKVVPDVYFEHVDKLGHSHGFGEWGQTMRCMGYHPLFALSRLAKDFLFEKQIGKKGALKIFWNYLTFRPDKDKDWYFMWDEDLVKFVREYQMQRIKEVFRARKKWPWS